MSLESSWLQYTVEQLIYSKPSDINCAEVRDNESHTELQIQNQGLVSGREDTFKATVW